MTEDTHDEQSLIAQAATGDQAALRQLLQQSETRLKRMLRLRLNRYLQGRIDENDILQEAYVDIAQHLPEYVQNPQGSFYLWLRHMTGLKLLEVHRRHLGTQRRDAEREVSLHQGGLPEVDSGSLAAQLLGTLTTPSQAAIKAEQRILVQEALNTMEPLDREVLALKHFEQLSTSEMAEVLGLSKAGAGHRYVKALQKLKEILRFLPGFADW